ncbi:tail fiber protein [Sphingomonas asaccharolytica]|uniref:tail fiber protein n=1 Tax=Sphingomonas asaccharolytica TaxID=40681 RepID=UPI00082959B6|nr:tail fiber protein [Sphingomonas asaccharolytica]
MSLETAQYIHQLNPSNPSGADRLKEGDDHIRMLKAVLKATFPGITGPLGTSVTQDFLNGLAGSLVPTGAIMLWHGAATDCPDGWAICDGSSAPKSDGTGNVTTPDMRNRVPVGASATHAVTTPFGQTSQTVTSAAAGGHTPTGSLPGHTHEAAGLTATAASSPAGVTLNFHNQTTYAGGGSQTGIHDATISDPGHSHGITVSGHTASSGAATISLNPVDAHSHAVTVDVTQPSLAVHFIIKV